MEDCLFCRIAAGEIPSEKVFEDDTVMAICDIAPQAPVHILVIPKAHYTSILDIGAKDTELLSHLIEVANKLSKENNLCENGFRLVINTGKDGGQSVPHLHIHLMGGRSFGWPAG